MLRVYYLCCNIAIILFAVANGTIPQIDFQHGVSDFVPNGRPFNLTATVVSTLNLTSLHWSPPDGLDPLPNKTISVHNGSTTTATFMLLRNAVLGDSGNYTLTAVNEYGQNSSKIYVDVHIDCPQSGLTEVLPVNFTAVEGYQANIACDFNGYYPASSHLRSWVSLPRNQTPVALNDQPSFSCNCWVEYVLGCSSDTQPGHCCYFRFIIHSTPNLNDSDTVFFCTNNHSKEDNSQARMFVVPSPKVMEPPRSLSTTAGSKAVFTCGFEASTDERITQIWWQFNGKYLAGPGQKRFQNYAVTWSSNDTNYIFGTLEIYSAQADNVGQYTCYCNYDERALDVNTSGFIQSDHKSAMLSVQPDHKKLIMIGGCIGLLVAVITIVTIIMVFYRVIVYRRRHWNYIHVPGKDEPLAELTDEILDQYIIEELFPLWEKLGKALNVPNRFLEEGLPADPAERLKVILREWRASEDHPTVSTLNKKLEQLGLKDFIP